MNCFSKVRFLITVLLLGLISTVYGGRTVDIDTILKHAAYESPEMIQAQLVIAEKSADRLRGIKTYLPEVNADYRLGSFYEIRKSIDPDDQFRYGAQYSITASHPLYRWGAVGSLRKQGFAQEAIAKNQAVIDYVMLIDRLRKGFNELVVMKAKLDSMNERLVLMQREAEEFEIRFTKGNATKNERNGVRLAKESFELQMNYEQNRLDQKLLEFKNDSLYLDLEIDNLPEDVSLPDYDISELQEWFEAYKGDGFDVSIPSVLAAEHLKAVDNELVINQSRQKPTLDFQGGVSQQPAEVNNSYEIQTIFFLGLGGRWNLFDRAESSSNERSLRMRRRQIDAALARTKAESFAIAQNAIELLGTSTESVKLRQRQIDLAEQLLEVAESNFKRGTATREEVQDATKRLLEARENIVEQKANTSNAYYAFLGAILKDPAIDYFNPDREI